MFGLLFSLVLRCCTCVCDSCLLRLQTDASRAHVGTLATHGGDGVHGLTPLGPKRFAFEFLVGRRAIPSLGIAICETFADFRASVSQSVKHSPISEPWSRNL